MSEERSKLAIFTILITMIGIFVATQFQEIGLTIMFLAILLFAFTIVRNRLIAIGAEAFALGSIIVWAGFLLAALPLIAFAWGFLGTSTQGILFGSGLILIFIGFTTEYYELNIKFLTFITRIRKQLALIISSLREHIFRSVWSLIALIAFILGILSIFVPRIGGVLPNLIGINYGVSVQFFVITILALGIEFRSLVYVIVQSIVQTLILIGKAIFLRLRHFPQLIADTGRFILSNLYRFGAWLVRVVKYLLKHTYLLGMIGATILGYFAINRSDHILGSSTILMLLVSLVNLIGVRGDVIAIRIGNIQQSAYRQSFTVRNLIRREHSGKCPQCEADIRPGISYCDNCGNFIPDCLVCRDTIFAGQETLVCSNCEHMGHADHLERWLSIRSICPNCRTEWQ